MNRREFLPLALAGGLLPSTFAQAPGAWPFPWTIGERLEYHILWGLARRVGTAVCKAERANLNGKPVIRLRVDITSNKIISKLYPIKGFMESFVDPATFLPIQFRKDMREGKRHADELTVFDWTQRKMTWKTFSKKRAQKIDPIRPDTRDILAFMYFFRGRAMVPGTTVKEHLMMDEKLYDLDLNFRKVEQVKLSNYGKINSVKVEPRAKKAFNGLLVTKGDMDLWVSTDPRKVCTQIVADTPFANVKIKLHKITGPGADFWVKP